MEVRDTVKKNVRHIHCSGELSLLERKLSNVLLLNAYDEMLTQREHRIPVPVLSALIGFDSNDTATLRRSLRRLATTPIEVDLLTDDREKKGTDSRYRVTAMISRGEIDKGVCHYAYDEKLADDLYDPEIYALINISVQRKFGSSFTLNLHENCLRFRAVGSTGWWSLEKFRKLVGATASIYDEFRLLNNRVIKPAVAENNRFAEILLEVEFRREKGRGAPVSGVRFVIKEHPQRALFRAQYDDNDALREKTAYQQLRAVGCSDRLALSAVIQDEGWAQRIAAYVTTKYESGSVRKPGAYAAKLIQSNADVGPSAIEARKTKAEKAGNTGKRAGENRQAMRIRFERERRESVKASMSAERRTALAELFIAADRSQGGTVAGRYDASAGKFRGVAEEAFHVFAAEQELGPYSEQDLDAWIERQQPGYG